MSYYVNKGKHTHYEPLTSNISSSEENVPLESSVQNIGPPPPMYYAPPSNQAWSVPPVAPQWNLATTIPPNMDQSSSFFQTFLQGKPKALGILVICVSILVVALGIGLVILDHTFTSISGISFWGPVFCIIAGSLTIAAQAKPNVCLLRGSLSLNIISCIFSMVAVILNLSDLVDFSLHNWCHYGYNDRYSTYKRLCQQQRDGAFIILSVLLVINLLLFCVTISTSIYGCRSLSKVQTITQVFVMQSDVSLATNPSAVPATYSQQPPYQPQYPVNAFGASPLSY